MALTRVSQELVQRLDQSAVQYFTADGITRAFDLGYPINSPEQIEIHIDGDYIYPDAYTVNNTTLFFNIAPAIGRVQNIVIEKVDLIQTAPVNIPNGVITAANLSDSITDLQAISDKLNVGPSTIGTTRGGTGLNTISEPNAILGSTSNAGALEYKQINVGPGLKVDYSSGNITFSLDFNGNGIVNPLTQIIAGTGLTGGGNLTQDRIIAMAPTSVVPGVYGNATNAVSLTVNAEGQITSISQSPISPASVPPTRKINTGTGLTGGGNLASDLTISVANTGVSAGTYGDQSDTPIITVNAQGQITAISLNPISGSGSVPSTRRIIAGTSLTGGGNLNADITLSLATTGITAGTYGDQNNTPQLTLNAEGQVVGITTITNIGPSGSVPATRSINAGTSLTGGGNLSSDITLSLATTGITAGTYGDSNHTTQLTLNAEGQVVGVTLVPNNGPSGSVPATRSINAGVGLTGGGNLSSDVTISVATTGITAGTYGDNNHTAEITVNALGQITHINLVENNGPVNTVPSSRNVIAGNGLTGGGNLSSDITVSVATVGTPGTYGDDVTTPQITVNSAGQITNVNLVPILTPGGTSNFDAAIAAAIIMS